MKLEDPNKRDSSIAAAPRDETFTSWALKISYATEADETRMMGTLKIRRWRKGPYLEESFCKDL
uniref:Uncharacterized protein n=1 Tax=Arabidopsis thaliana TaxID=3702 RepID=Q0WMM6_ARATH|nr:hypothetical protein [Arabidopsis thaliana]